MEDTTVRAQASWPLPLAEHPTLEIESEFAQLAIVPTSGGEDPFLEAVGDGSGAPRIDVHGERGTTRVRVGGAFDFADERWWEGRWWDPAFWDKRWWKRNFRARLVAHVPPSVHARVRASAARVHVERLTGCDLVIETDAGALSVDDVSGRLRIATDAGRIDGRAVAGSLDIATSAGAIRLDITSLDPGRHKIRTNMGAVRIELAQAMPVNIRTRTTMGSARVEFPSSRDAAATLDVEADLGSIRISGSSRIWTEPPHDAAPRTTPYRTVDAEASGDAAVKAILERVASGELTPDRARDLLRDLGWP